MKLTNSEFIQLMDSAPLEIPSFFEPLKEDERMTLSDIIRNPELHQVHVDACKKRAEDTEKRKIKN